MIIYTGRITNDKIIPPFLNPIDITAKSASTPVGRLFAPTWPMVMATKNNPDYTWDHYKGEYDTLIRKRLTEQGFGVLDDLLEVGCATFVCFCREQWDCHRNLAKQIVKDYCVFKGVNFKYNGFVK